MDARKSEATRHLCAAAYLDQLFRDTVIERLVEDEHHAVAPSIGYSTSTIVKHCLEAARANRSRDLLLAILAVPLFIGALPLYFASNGSPTWAVALFLAALLAGWAVEFRNQWGVRNKILKHFMRDNFDSIGVTAGTRHQDAIERLDSWQEQDVVIYSGFSPFVGFGEEVGGWSFALDLRKPKERFGDLSSPKAFTAAEMYGYLESELLDLKLEKLEMRDRLYVNGRDIRSDKRFLKNVLSGPVAKVDREVVERTFGKTLQTARHYKSIQLVGWDGDLVVTAFLGICILEDNLSVTVRYFLLTPVAERYRQIDSWRRNIRLRDYLGLAITSAFIVPFSMAYQPFKQLSRLGELLSHHRTKALIEKEIKDNLLFDYGTAFSLRQFACSNNYLRYFQKLDKEMYMGILDRQLLDKIVDFLDNHDIDTSDVKERRTTILNSGVIMTGGSIQAPNVVVGTGAKGFVSRVSQTLAAQTEKKAA